MAETEGKHGGIVQIDQLDEPLGEGDAQAISNTPGFGTDRDEALCGLLHDLHNVLVRVLLDAQSMARRLPSYSVWKRNLRGVERSAQQGILLVRRLLDWYQDGKTSATK